MIAYERVANGYIRPVIGGMGWVNMVCDNDDETKFCMLLLLYFDCWYRIQSHQVPYQLSYYHHLKAFPILIFIADFQLPTWIWLCSSQSSAESASRMTPWSWRDLLEKAPSKLRYIRLCTFGFCSLRKQPMMESDVVSRGHDRIYKAWSDASVIALAYRSAER